MGFVVISGKVELEEPRVVVWILTAGAGCR